MQEISGVEKLAIQEIEKELKSFVKGKIQIELDGKNRAIAYIEEKNIGALIGKKGERISSIEKRLGVRIDVRPYEDRK